MADLHADDVMVRWRALHSDWATQKGCAYTGAEYAYGVAYYRLGGRRSLPQPSTYVGSDDKANRREIRRQVDAIIGDLESREQQ
jgi:hypothetical protein